MGKLWLCRGMDSIWVDDYLLFSRRPPKEWNHKTSTSLIHASFCPVQFEKITGLRLKPGEGPVRVELTMKIVGR